MNSFAQMLHFMEVRTKKRRKAYTLSEYRDIEAKFFNLRTSILSDMERLGLGEWDLNQFESSTRALKLIKPTHTVLDENSTVTSEGSFGSYSPAVIKQVGNWLSKNRVAMEKFSLSAPRGKFMGWPFPVPGSDRKTGNVIAVTLLRLIEQYKTYSLQRLEDVVKSAVGFEALTIGGERIMHTSKKLPAILIDGRIENSEIEPRVRLMAMSPKLHVIFNRRVVKDLLNCVIKPNPLHPVDRSVIANRINRARKRGWFIKAYDQEKFDRNHGKTRLESVLDCLELLVGREQRLNLEYELDVPLKMQEGPIFRGKPMLLSGASSTTVVGCVASQLALASVLPLLGYAFEDFGSKWDALIWGDDLLVMTDREVNEAEVIEAYKSIGLSVSYEEKAKFLGYIYESDYNSYPSFRLFQNLFPERIKNAPLFKLGIYSKMGIFNRLPRTETCKVLSKHAQSILGDEYGFDAIEMLKPWGSNKYVKEGIAEAQKIAGGIGALDDIIYSLGHAVDLDTSYDILGIPEDERSWQTVDKLEKNIASNLVEEIRLDPLQVIKRLCNKELTLAEIESQQELEVESNEQSNV